MGREESSTDTPWTSEAPECHHPRTLSQPAADGILGTDVRPGDVVAGKYRIEAVLGAGGMGVVAAARHIDLDGLVALKFLLPKALDNPEIVNRFNREARAAVKIKSEHVARVTDIGRLDTGAPYIVMEHLKGEDLDERLKREIRLSIPEAVDKMLQAMEALAEAHSHGIVHRDLKPENLFVVQRADGSDCIKVLDFGIAKMNETSHSGARDLTQTQALLGSPSYMSPEQLKSARDVDQRCDVWALGVCLYKLISGSPPFRGENIHALLTAVIQSSPMELTELCPEAPPELARAIAKCLEKDRDNRYADVAEFATAISHFGSASAQISLERIQRTVAGAGGTLVPTADAGIMTEVGDEYPSAPPPRAPSVGGTQAAWNRTGITGERTSEPEPAKRRFGAKAIGLAVGALGALGVAGAFLLGSNGSVDGEPVTANAPEAAPALAGSSAVETARAEPARAEPEAAPRPTAPSVADAKLLQEPKPEPRPKAKVAPEPKSAPKVTLTIESNPPGADVYRHPSGLKVGRTPYSTTRTAAEGELVYLVSKRGYESEEVSLEADETGKAKVRLKKKEPERRRRQPKPQAVEPQKKPDPPTTTPAPEVSSPEEGVPTVDPFAK